MYVPSLEIRNFRGFQQVNFEECSNLNFIFGKNNCGKTSVLEAIFLGLHGGYKRLFQERRLSMPMKANDFLYFFYNSQRENSPYIDIGGYRLRMDMNEEKVVMNYSYQDVEVTNHISFSDKELNNQHHIGITNAYQGDFNRYVSLIPLTKFENLGLHNEEFDKDGINAILDDNNDVFITQVLNQIDPAITGWAIGMGDTIRVELNSERRRLLNLMGDGTRKVFALLSSMYHLRNGILLIDEIENGLHYTSIKTFLRVLFSFVKEFPKTQIFMTSHSNDVIKSLNALMEEDPQRGKLTSVYSLARRSNNRHETFRFDKENLEYALEHEFDIR